MAFSVKHLSTDLFDGFRPAPPKNEVLLAIERIVDWRAVREQFDGVYSGDPRGRKAFDPVLMVKLQLLKSLYALSDADTVAEAADRLSFREFLGIRTLDDVPDSSSMTRFRDRLREAGDAYRCVMEEIDAQMAKAGVAVKPGSIAIIDATLVPAAVNPPRTDPKTGEERAPLDPDADFAARPGKKAVYGFKFHASQDRETGLIRNHVVTEASVHDAVEFATLVEGDEAIVLVDKGYTAKKHDELLREKKVGNGIMKKKKPKCDLSRHAKRRNKRIAKVRGFIEGTFGAMKRFMRCGRAIYRGLDKTHEQFDWTVRAWNLRRGAAMLGAT